MEQTFDLIGRIDSLEEIGTEKLLLDYLRSLDENCYVVFDLDKGSDAPGNLKPDQRSSVNDFGKYQLMYRPLGLSGTFMVTGIEGKNYDGYVPGQRGEHIDGVWTTFPAPENDAPWPLEVQPEWSMFNIMEAVASSEYNGYPHVNHVWFEFCTIDQETKTIQFSMGS